MPRLDVLINNVGGCWNTRHTTVDGLEHTPGARSYNQSMLANVLFTYELARRLANTGVTVNALRPGVVSTGLGATDPGRSQRLLVPLARPFMQRPAQGAATPVLLASDPSLNGTTGRYFAGGKAKESSRRSYDRDVAPPCGR